jgi:hypothetical protein
MSGQLTPSSGPQAAPSKQPPWTQRIAHSGSVLHGRPLPMHRPPKAHRGMPPTVQSASAAQVQRPRKSPSPKIQMRPLPPHSAFEPH